MIASLNLDGVSGIYCAINRDSLKCYVGSSRDVGSRRIQHINSARNGGRGNFHRALRELGQESFDFELIEKCEGSNLKLREDFWITFYNAASLSGFNTLPYSCAFVRGKASQVTKDRISSAKKGNVSERMKDHLRRLNLSRRGVKRSPEAVEKVRIALTGRKPSREAIEKMMATLKGRPATAATAAARIANTGKPRSEAVRLKIKEGLRKAWASRSDDEIRASADKRLSTLGQTRVKNL